MLKLVVKVLPELWVFVWVTMTSPVEVSVSSLAKRSSVAVTETLNEEPVLTVLLFAGEVIVTPGAWSRAMVSSMAGWGYDKPRLPTLSWATALR